MKPPMMLMMRVMVMLMLVLVLMLMLMLDGDGGGHGNGDGDVGVWFWWLFEVVGFCFVFGFIVADGPTQPQITRTHACTHALLRSVGGSVGPRRRRSLSRSWSGWLLGPLFG